MAHYAELDENNIVIGVYYVDNRDILDENGNECDELGINQCKKGLNNPNARVIKTSYNNNIRNRYASIGFSYDEELDAFIPPKPYPSSILDPETLDWKLPVQMPQTPLENGFYYLWDEDMQNWKVEQLPPKTITLENFRSQLTLSEKLLFDTPSTGTPTQQAVLNTFKIELPLTVGEEKTTEFLDLLVSSEIYTQERLDEIIENI